MTAEVCLKFVPLGEKDHISVRHEECFIKEHLDTNHLNT